MSYFWFLSKNHITI